MIEEHFYENGNEISKNEFYGLEYINDQYDQKCGNCRFFMPTIEHENVFTGVCINENFQILYAKYGKEGDEIISENEYDRCEICPDYENYTVYEKKHKNDLPAWLIDED